MSPRAHLEKHDPVMEKLIHRYGWPGRLERSTQPFDKIVRAIIGQQLSSKAAETISMRLELHIRRPFKPFDILSLPLESLRKSGVSSAKSDYIVGLSKSVLDGKIDLEHLTRADNRCVIKTLTAQRGIGLWTSQMFMIFGCGNDDVLATSDAGLRRATTIFYGCEIDNEDDFSQFGVKWKPYRSYASLMLWRALDGK